MTRAALRPACIGALAILYATAGGGAWTRRSAIAWMMASWGARLTVQALYTRSPGGRALRTSSFSLLTSSLFFSLPAFFPSVNADPRLSPLELAAAGVWVVAFACETTADRQLLRFRSSADHEGLDCRTGLWRYSRHAHEICDVSIWISFAAFAAASAWGWLSFACPLARLMLIRRDRGFFSPQTR